MRVQIPPRHEVVTPLTITLNKLRLFLSLDHREWRGLLQLSEREYQKCRDDLDRTPAEAVFALCDALHIGIEQLWAGNIDFESVLAHFYETPHHLPERYRQGAFSKVRTIRNTLNFVESVSGYDLRHHALMAMQTKESTLLDLDAPVNLHMVSDLFSYLRRHGFRDGHFFEVGVNSVALNKNTLLAHELDGTRRPKELYQKLIEELTPFFERNCDYQIVKLTQAECLIESKINQEVSEALKTSKPGSMNGCLVRKGILASAPAFARLPFSSVTKVSCVYDNAPACRFHVKFHKPSKRRAVQYQA